MKLASSLALALIVVGTSVTSSSASQLETNGNQTGNIEMSSIEAKEAISNSIHHEYFGDDAWKNVRTQVANYTNVPFKGESGSKFTVHTNKYDLRYHFANSGKNTFTWKIFDPKGKLWSTGTLAPGQSKTYTAPHDMDDIPVGLYRFSVITTNGGLGEFSFSARVLD